MTHPTLPRHPLTSATLDWFHDGSCDVKYLDMWQEIPLSYTPGQPTGEGWHVDHQELRIGHDSSGELFGRAADRLMRYRFYPRQILKPIGDHDLGDSRHLRVGDRILQRFQLITVLDFHVVDILGMVEVVRTVVEPRSRGFTYMTTAAHFEEGEWSACVHWLPDGELLLQVDSISRPSPDEPLRNHSMIRKRQLSSLREAMAQFKQATLASSG